jgi:cyclopropane fatty-acyl-phospholipid synthase-like methyltransferase
VTPDTTIGDLVAHFERKTQAILQRYGPGPRVHYHAGLVDEPPPQNASEHVLRRQLTDAQERVLSHAAGLWDASSTLCGDVLDVGCGLGGGAMFWAQEFGAQVTAVTCVPSHVDWVARFAERGGVASRVQALLCDASEVPGENRFDAAVAFETACYLARKQWFPRIASLLRPGGRLFIVDCFLVRSDYAEPFDRYWHTRIGTIPEYLAAAEEAGLKPGLLEDISHRTVHFWTTTRALIQAEARDHELGPAEAIRYEASLRAHELIRQGLMANGLRYVVMSFGKPG